MTGTSRWRNSLLPGDLREDDGGRSARDWFVDLLMFGIAIAVAALVLSDSFDEHSDSALALDLLLGVISLVLLCWRRSHPDQVGLVTAVASIVSATAAGPALLAAFNVAHRGSRRGLTAVVAATAVSVFAFPAIYPPGDSYWLNVVIGALLTAVVFSWGLLVRIRREQLLALRQRAADLEEQQRLQVEQARDSERRRIAREMHDVLAHRVSLLSVQAGALEFNPTASADEIERAAAVIRETAHAALEELREVIGVLRDEPGSAGAELQQPSLDAIPALVGESREAGMRVSCRFDVEGGLPSQASARTAYRIVQEGLTNARKHAPDAKVEVEIAGGEALTVVVISRRPVGVSVRAEPLPGSGSGLIGLSERVELAGGELEHGPDAAGDFVVRARLPWTQ